MSAADPLAAQRNQIPRGILYMVASTVVFAGVNAIVKWELARYPLGEVAFFRSVFALLRSLSSSCRAPGLASCAPAPTSRMSSAGCRNSAR